jgi:hypothetical protein
LLSLLLFDLRAVINVLNLQGLHTDSVAHLESARLLIQQVSVTGDLFLINDAILEEEAARSLMVE